MLEGGEQDGRGGRGRQAQRQQRRQRAGDGGVVGGLRPRHGLDRALAELLGVLGQPLLDQIGEEGRDLAAAGRQGTDREAEQRAAQPGLPGARPVRGAHPHRAGDGVDLLLLVPVAGGGVERLADGEEADRHDDGVDAVEQLEDAEGEAGLAGLQVDADQAERQADEQAGEAARRGFAEHGGDGGEGQDHQREILGRPEQQGELDQLRGQEGQSQRGDGAGDEGADGGGGQRLGAAALARHHVAVDGGDDQPDSPGVLSRIEVVEPPYMAP